MYFNIYLIVKCLYFNGVKVKNNIDSKIIKIIKNNLPININILYKKLIENNYNFILPYENFFKVCSLENGVWLIRMDVNSKIDNYKINIKDINNIVVRNLDYNSFIKFPKKPSLANYSINEFYKLFLEDYLSNSNLTFEEKISYTKNEVKLFSENEKNVNEFSEKIINYFFNYLNEKEIYYINTKKQALKNEELLKIGDSISDFLNNTPNIVYEEYSSYNKNKTQKISKKSRMKKWTSLKNKKKIVVIQYLDLKYEVRIYEKNKIISKKITDDFNYFQGLFL